MIRTDCLTTLYSLQCAPNLIFTYLCNFPNCGCHLYYSLLLLNFFIHHLFEVRLPSSYHTQVSVNTFPSLSLITPTCCTSFAFHFANQYESFSSFVLFKRSYKLAHTLCLAFAPSTFNLMVYLHVLLFTLLILSLSHVFFANRFLCALHALLHFFVPLQNLLSTFFQKIHHVPIFLSP